MEEEVLPAFDGLDDKPVWSFPTDVHVWMAWMGLALIGLVAVQVLARCVLEVVLEHAGTGSSIETVPVFTSVVTPLLLGIALVAVYRNGTYFSKHDRMLSVAALVSTATATLLLVSYVVIGFEAITHLLPHGINGTQLPTLVGVFDAVEYLPIAGMTAVGVLASAAISLSGDPQSSRRVIGAAGSGLAVYVVFLVVLQAGAGPPSTTFP